MSAMVGAAHGTATAMVWEGGRTFTPRTLPLPEPTDGQVLVALETATICGSDRHTVSGRRQEACPSVLGHEGVGRVVRSARHGIEVGERVVFSVIAACGDCVRCMRGLSAKCERVRKLGHEPSDGDWMLSGTYATHVLLQAGQEIVPVPVQVPAAVATTAGCAMATVMAVIERAGELGGRRVLVNGVGMLGLVALAVARDAGAEHVVAVDPSPQARQLAAACADQVLVPDEAAGLTVDVAMELSGARAGVFTCLDALDLGGTAVLAGTVAPVGEVGLDPELLVRGLRTVTGVHNYEPRHLHRAVEFLAGPGTALPWERILGPAVELTELASAFTTEGGSFRTPVTIHD